MDVAVYVLGKTPHNRTATDCNQTYKQIKDHNLISLTIDFSFRQWLQLLSDIISKYAFSFESHP